MSRIADPDILALAAADEEPWEGLTDNEVIFQRPCPDCEFGLLYNPARFHSRCGGTGFLTRTVVIRTAD